ncbi:hypothetical protein CDV31_012493 [Fusarium ambrosium]|uniref:2EXR domain-containing protein n=1 Tax=Fusarium ambrosium TaxID=131363 RepID=A0A428T9N6_9HYPO|nr:hypothetical protein CDV31_012493 [Fusarium ambrosium]
MADNRQSSGSAPEASFTPFQKLPPELRYRIWNDALAVTAEQRLIRINIHDRRYKTHHSCIEVHDRFCGQHTPCKTYINGQPSRISNCMINGYFAYDRDDSTGPEDPKRRANVRNIGLSCREARSMVVSRYPETLTVYRGSYLQGSGTRHIRCDPASDVLVITKMPVHNSHPHPSPGGNPLVILEENALSMRYPRDSSLFTEFRRMLSSFQHVAFLHQGHRRRSFPLDLARSEDFISLLFYFESMQSLYLWPDPELWPDVYENVVEVETIEDLRILDYEPRWDIENTAEDIMNKYKVRAETQNAHFVEGEEHWIPQPKPLEKIGCYAAAAWIPRRITEDQLETGTMPGVPLEGDPDPNDPATYDFSTTTF